MTETFELRNKPELKIVMSEDRFEIVDISEMKNNGKYNYAQLREVKFMKKKTNWFVTILSYLFTFFFDGPTGDFYKDKEKLVLVMENNSLNISLIDCDMKALNSVMKILVEKIN